MKVPKALFVGFLPFGKNKVNPSQQIVQAILRRPPSNFDCEGHVLPVHSKYVYELFQKIKPCSYNLIVGLGLHAKTDKFLIESQGKNIVVDYNIREKIGIEKLVPIYPSEKKELKLKTSLPVEKIASDLKLEGYQIGTSLDAGRWLCNMFYYVALQATQNCPHTKVGFIHLPNVPENAPTVHATPLEIQIQFVYTFLKLVKVYLYLSN